MPSEDDGEKKRSLAQRAKGLVARVSLSSPWVLIAGVFLLAVPTVFAVFAPETLAWSLGRRWVAFALWLLAAFFIGLVALARDRAWDYLVTMRREQRRYARIRALEEALAALLRCGTKGFPESYSFTLYLAEEGSPRLVPYYPKRHVAVPPEYEDDPRIFESGKGATGKAWELDTLIEISGPPVSDGVHGLSEVQQQFFGKYRSVVATPVRVDDAPIGVLTAISRNEDRHFAQEPAQSALRELADSLGVIMHFLPDPNDLLA